MLIEQQIRSHDFIVPRINQLEIGLLVEVRRTAGALLGLLVLAQQAHDRGLGFLFDVKGVPDDLIILRPLFNKPDILVEEEGLDVAHAQVVNIAEAFIAVLAERRIGLGFKPLVGAEGILEDLGAELVEVLEIAEICDFLS